MTVCEECGCTKVQTKTWVGINSGAVYEPAGSGGEQMEDNWCPDCGEHCMITSKEIFDSRNKEEEE